MLSSIEGMYLCLVDDVPDNGHVPIELFGHNLILSRSGENISLDDNACRHRGHKICDVRTVGPVKCPYHGLKFIPNFQYSITQLWGMLFVSGVAGTAQISRLASNRGRHFYSKGMTVKCPFYLWIENTMDPNHLKQIHGEHFFQLFQSVTPENVEFSSCGKVSSYALPIKADIVSRYERVLKTGLEPWFRQTTVYPHLSMTSFLGVFYSIETAVPVIGATEVLTKFFTSNRVEVPKPILSSAMKSNSIILEEDKQICESWAKSNHYRKPDSWLPGEERIKVYDDLILEWLSE